MEPARPMGIVMSALLATSVVLSLLVVKSTGVAAKHARLIIARIVTLLQVSFEMNLVASVLGLSGAAIVAYRGTSCLAPAQAPAVGCLAPTNILQMIQLVNAS